MYQPLSSMSCQCSGLHVESWRNCFPSEGNRQLVNKKRTPKCAFPNDRSSHRRMGKQRAKHSSCWTCCQHLPVQWENIHWRVGLVGIQTSWGVLLPSSSLPQFFRKGAAPHEKLSSCTQQGICICCRWSRLALCLIQGSYNDSMKYGNLAIVGPLAKHIHRSSADHSRSFSFLHLHLNLLSGSQLGFSCTEDLNLRQQPKVVNGSEGFWVCCRILLMNAVK